MNRTFKIITSGWALTAVFLLSIACGNNRKTNHPDSKEVAEAHNDAKFNDVALKNDAEYISDAYSNGLCEIEAAKRAKEYASAQETRELASMLIESHVKLNDKLQRLAGEKQVSLQQGLTPGQLEELKQNGDQQGVEYDKAYLSDVVNKHQKSISMFEKASNKSEDAQVKELFGSALPELRNHLDMAMNARNKLQ
jgi:putative membrane protein